MTVKEIEHAPGCIADTAAESCKREEWVARWPRYCQTCGGAGGFYYSGNYDQPPDFEPCHVCTLYGICPRCGEPGLTSTDRGDACEGGGPCKACGWNYDDSLLKVYDCD